MAHTARDGAESDAATVRCAGMKKLKRGTRAFLTVLMLTSVGYISSLLSRGHAVVATHSELAEGLRVVAPKRLPLLSLEHVGSIPIDSDELGVASGRGVLSRIGGRQRGFLPNERAKPHITDGWSYIRVTPLPFVLVVDYDGASWFGGAGVRRHGYSAVGRAIRLGLFGWSYVIGEWGTGAHWHS